MKISWVQPRPAKFTVELTWEELVLIGSVFAKLRGGNAVVQKIYDEIAKVTERLSEKRPSTVLEDEFNSELTDDFCLIRIG
jgi:hypothetical protein